VAIARLIRGRAMRARGFAIVASILACAALGA
jgi:hypothetical protein